MSILYINENGARINYEANRFIVSFKDGMNQSIPAETLESVTLLESTQMTTQSMTEFLKRGIPVAVFSKSGQYFGRLVSTGHVKAALQRQQASLYETSFSLSLSRRIIAAKIHNQEVVLRRYGKSSGCDVEDELKMMRMAGEKLRYTQSNSEVMGYEGTAAKYYFRGLSRCVEEPFRFHGRSRRPPKDPFNSMLSLGYSLLMNEIYGILEQKGLNPYFGFLHSDAENHPTLASDMMEEWRAVIVDAVAMSMINGHEVRVEEFLRMEEPGGVVLTRPALSRFLRKIERKLQTEVKYLAYENYAMSFRTAMTKQADKLIKAIETEDASLYEPLRIR